MSFPALNIDERRSSVFSSGFRFPGFVTTLGGLEPEAHEACWFVVSLRRRCEVFIQEAAAALRHSRQDSQWTLVRLRRLDLES